MIHELSIPINVGNHVLSKLPDLPTLKGKYKDMYEAYVKRIDENISDAKKHNEDTDLLEMEKVHIECFVRFLQEEYHG